MVKSQKTGKRRKSGHKITRKCYVAIGCFAVCAVLVIAFLIYRDQMSNSTFRLVDEDISGTDTIYTIKYKGKTYDYNNALQSVLLIGVDSTGKMTAKKNGEDNGRADNIDLIIMDRRNHKVKILPISRDTMTEVPKLSAEGYETGTYLTHLGYAFSYGDGAERSCENVCNGVSYLLNNVDIRYYVCTNLDSIAFANDLLGGVEVNVPNNDLAGRYPELVQGNDVKLTDRNVTDFLRYRDTSVDFSNNGRMERQQAFLDGFVKNVKARSVDEYNDMWRKLNSEESNILTNMTKGQFLKIVSKINDYEYDASKSNLKIEGTDGVEDGHDVFYPDEEKLKQLVVDTFYIERK